VEGVAPIGGWREEGGEETKMYINSLLTRKVNVFRFSLLNTLYRAGMAGTVRQVWFWLYHFLVTLQLVGMGYTIGGEWHPHGGAQLM